MRTATSIGLFVLFGCLPTALVILLTSVFPLGVPHEVIMVPVVLWTLYTVVWSWITGRNMVFQNRTLEDAGLAAEAKPGRRLW